MTNQRDEAKLLALRLCLRWQTIEAWMKREDLNAIADLMRRYPGASHAQAMQRAADEIFRFVLAE